LSRDDAAILGPVAAEPAMNAHRFGLAIDPGSQETTMVVQILVHTPIWVYATFFVLLGFGLSQTRTRTVGKLPALLLPAGMLALSLAGIYTSFGLATLPLVAWGMGLTMATAVGSTFFRDTRIHVKATDGTFFIPGSWVPLVVMMTIFCVKYGYAVMHAYHAAGIATPMLIGALSALYGLLSGYFSSRAVTLISLAQTA
jgi:hypothetical protein